MSIHSSTSSFGIKMAIFSIGFMLSVIRLEAAQLKSVDDASEFFSIPVRASLHVYRNFLGGTRSGMCPMFPSDSTFALEAIRRHGVVFGSLMTADRLHRCGHDWKDYEKALTPLGLKLLDPVPELRRAQ